MSNPESQHPVTDRLKYAAQVGMVALAAAGGAFIAETATHQPNAWWVTTPLIAGIGIWATERPKS